MKTLWGEMTRKGLIQMIALGVVLMAATATATYWATDRANHKAPAQVAGPVPGVAPAPGAALTPAQGQPGVFYAYHPTQGFVPVSQPGQGVAPQSAYPNSLLQENGQIAGPAVAAPGLYPYGQAPVSPCQDTRPAPEATNREVVKEKVVHVNHVHQAAARSSSSRQEGGALSGISKTTKGALIGGVLGASGGALMGGRGKHKTANGALVGGVIGTVAGGLLGHAMENK